jgi:hypothetical protein
LAAPSVSVPAGGRTRVGFTVAVPADASPGDHLAGLVFQDVDTATAEEGPLSVETVTRSVIGALIHIEGPSHGALRVNSAVIGDLEGGQELLSLGLANVGELLARPTMTIRLRSATYDRTEAKALDTFLPGDTIEYRLAWPDPLDKGPYTITVTLSGDGVEAAVYEQAIDRRALPKAPSPSPGSSDRPAASASSTHAPLRVAAAAATAFLVVVIIGLLATRRRRASRGAAA